MPCEHQGRLTALRRFWCCFRMRFLDSLVPALTLISCPARPADPPLKGWPSAVQTRVFTRSHSLSCSPCRPTSDCTARGSPLLPLGGHFCCFCCCCHVSPASLGQGKRSCGGMARYTHGSVDKLWCAEGTSGKTTQTSQPWPSADTLISSSDPPPALSHRIFSTGELAVATPFAAGGDHISG